jgi:hypothetical protein
MGRHAPAETGRDVQPGPKRPLYARALRLRYIAPGGLACFALFEGSVGAATILALAGLISWYAIAVLPVAVALMVKLNDIVAGRLDEVVDGTRPRPTR